MKRLYIITGAAGHLAGTIIRCLRGSDCHIRALILPSESGEDDRQVTWYKGDVTRRESLEAIFSGVECNEVIVIHAAGIISIDDRPSPKLHDVNVEGTRNIIAQCLRHHVRRLVYISSVHAIPERDDGEVITEAASFSPELVTGAYARSKAEATQAVLDAAKAGLDAVIVQPSGIIGPYDEGNNHIVQLVKMCIDGKLPAGVKGGYDFVDVRDVARGCIAAAEYGRAGESYILSNRYCTIAEILESVRAVAGGRRKICLPLSLARVFAPLFEWYARARHTRALYTRYALSTISGGGRFSHEKATRELGYAPRDMCETIRDTVYWLRGQEVPLEPVSNERIDEHEMEHSHRFELRSLS